MKSGKCLLIVLVVMLFAGSCDSGTDNRMFEAIEEGDVPKLRELVSQNANADVIDSEGKTPLMRAIESGNFELVRVLISNEVDPNYAPEESGGETPISLAVKVGTPAMVQGLLVYGAVAVAPGGGSLIALAEEHGRAEIVELLKNMGIQ